ncbi:MAG: DNA mismatch repair endonuclease MutL [Elusimicrobia bacterium]|nr:DNA mismatch repair endonuclease MutL [Elusimicrobiota bacterium]
MSRPDPMIHRLSPEVASRIAAGEVIERPASALKELLENALDAGARRITVECAGAGRTSLRVVDDGCGMSPEDCALALERHATSKITDLGDLERLATFGFRGEALYAAAAVSRLTLASTLRGAKSGWKVQAEGGKVVSSGPAPAVPGTAVELRDLFYNTPARRKFLKSDAYERGRLAAIVEEAALADPALSLTYKSESRTVLRFAPEPGRDLADGLRRRAVRVLGEANAAALLPIVVDRPEMKLRLFVSPWDALAATRDFQYWFVNRRPVSARILQQALYRAYQGRPSDRHPVCVGHLELPGDAFDVNVHPGKREIRFRSDRDVFELVSGLVASALLKSKAPAPITPAPRVSVSTGAVRELAAAYHAVLEQAPLALETAPAESFAAAEGLPRWFTPPFRFLGQIERAYLVFEASGGLFILDQHAAAERILFERFLKEVEQGRARSQKLMLPMTVELPASAVEKVLSLSDRLERLGFSFEAFGKRGLHCLAVPALFHKEADLKELVHRLLDSLHDPVSAAEAVQHDAVATVACKAAVKAHDALSEKEALRLVEDLKDCRDGSCCPHGRRTMLALSRDELARRFQRPGAPPL